MKLPIFQIDAFASEVFKGNPAAVCPLKSWIDDELMQNIAAENNLSETAFFVEEGDSYRLRWFTPQTEVDLCGHATLATAYVIANEIGHKSELITFQTRSGELRVRGKANTFTLDFPAQPPKSCSAPSELLPALGIDSADILLAQDYLVAIESESDVRNLKPNFSMLLGLPNRGVVVTAKSDKYDFVSRWFGPNVGVNEDPVTGSAHCALVPYWSERLAKLKLSAAQLSERGGEISCELKNDRVFLTGSAVKYLSGTIEV